MEERGKALDFGFFFLESREREKTIRWVLGDEGEGRTHC